MMAINQLLINTTDVDGIKKLRALIRELAVCGKLVPQDKPFGWVWQRLGNLCILENGDRGKNYPNKSALVAVGIPFINAGHLKNGEIDKNAMTFITKEHFSILRAGKFRENDILFCLRGSLGKCALVTGIAEGAIASSLVIIRLLPNLDPAYFINYFSSLLGLKMIDKYNNGTVQPNLSSTDLAKFLVPLPSLAEQKRVVAKVDELMALCDRMEAQYTIATEFHKKLVRCLLGTLATLQPAEDFSVNWRRIAAHFDVLFTTKDSIQYLRHTLLQLAVLGKLVPQDIDGWQTVRLGQIGDWRAGTTPSRSASGYYGGKIPWFKSGELREDYIHTSEEHITEHALKGCSLRLNQPGDVLLAMYGATIGKVAILQVAATTNQAVCVCSPYKVIFNRYLLILLKEMRANFIAQGAGGAQQNISRAKIISTIVTIPPIAEQHRIVAKVDELLAFCDQLQARVSAARVLQETLIDALLDRSMLV